MQWLLNQLTQWVTNLVNGIVNDLIKFVVDALNSLLVNPTNMDALPGFHDLLTAIQTMATPAVAFILVKEMFMNQLEDLNDTAVSPLVLIKNALVSIVLIWASPLIVTTVIMPLIIQITQVLNATLGTTDNLTANISSSLALSSAGTSTMLVAMDSGIGEWAALVVTIAIVAFIFYAGVQAGLRWAELYFLTLAAPLLALSKASFNNSWNVWLRETIAVSLSQLIQYFGVLMALTVLVHPDTIQKATAGTVNGVVEILMVIGFLVFAVRGPKTLRSLISTNGSAFRALGSMVKSAAGGIGGA